MAGDEELSGWQPDPFDRYEERYFVRGAPTAHVRARGIDLTDPQAVAPSLKVAEESAEANQPRAAAEVDLGTDAMDQGASPPHAEETLTVELDHPSKAKSDMELDKKICPFCAETIKAAAIKCKAAKARNWPSSRSRSRLRTHAANKRHL